MELKGCHPALRHGGGRSPVVILFFIWRLHGKPRHGYSLLRDAQDLPFATKPSTIYSVLSKMELAGLIKSHMDEKSGRVRRLYSTTAKGWNIFQTMRKKKVRGVWLEFMKSLISGR